MSLARGKKSHAEMQRLKGFRFQREIIAYGAWTYHRFSLSTADVEYLLAQHSAIVSQQTIRQWTSWFDRHFADCTKHEWSGKKDNKWYLDEVIVLISDEKYCFWRAVHANEDVRDILVDKQRNAKAAKHFLRRFIDSFGILHFVIADQLRSHLKSIRYLASPSVHQAHKDLNSRIEGSRWPTRKRENIMGRYNSTGQPQRIPAAYDQINAIFRLRRRQLSSALHHHNRSDVFELWVDYAHEMTACRKRHCLCSIVTNQVGNARGSSRERESHVQRSVSLAAS